MSNINKFIRASRKQRRNQRRKQRTKRRTLRRHSANNLLTVLTGRQNSGRNDEPSYVTQHIHPILGERSDRPLDKRMRNENYRCGVLQREKDKMKCRATLQHYNAFVKGYINDFILNPTEINTNILIDKLINLKHDTSLIFGDEHQTEIVNDFLRYLFNINQEAYYNLQQHPRFYDMLIHEHIPRQTMYNRIKRTLKIRSPKVGIARTNRSRSRSRSRSRNSSLNNL